MIEKLEEEKVENEQISHPMYIADGTGNRELKMIKSKVDKTCLSHECTECGKKLRVKIGRSDIIFMVCFFVAMIGVMFLFTKFLNRIETKPYCKIQTTQDNIIISQEVECPLSSNIKE